MAGKVNLDGWGGTGQPCLSQSADKATLEFPGPTEVAVLEKWMKGYHQHELECTLETRTTSPP